jgi:hypothetical protein
MEDLPGQVDLDAKIIVERLREIIERSTVEYPRDWVPQASFDELLLRYNREAIHLHPSIHHLHQHWDMGQTRKNAGTGKGPKALVLRVLSRIINSVLDRYFTEEQEFRAAIAQSVDALAYRIDEVAGSDERELLDIVRNDLLSLSKYIDESIETRLKATE